MYVLFALSIHECQWLVRIHVNGQDTRPKIEWVEEDINASALAREVEEGGGEGLGGGRPSD
jgi:hypothetical protein